MRIFIILTLFNSAVYADLSLVLNPLPDAKQSQNSNLQFNLVMAIALTDKTTIGKELKPHIDELIQQNKIHLASLQNGHYGESGEGCVIKDGQYYYEGLFVVLNDQLGTEELASSLVHEVSHYRMIKELVELKFNFPVQVSAFEMSAFATQFEFISELEQLKLVDRQFMFTNEAQTVANIMQSAYQLRINWSEIGFDKVYKQLLEYGYPQNELNRTISQRPEKDCVGSVNKDY